MFVFDQSLDNEHVGNAVILHGRLFLLTLLRIGVLYQSFINAHLCSLLFIENGIAHP